MSTTLTLQSTTASVTPSGTNTTGPITFTGSIAQTTYNVNLIAGLNAVAVPSGAVGVIITPPTTNAVAIKYGRLPGVSGTVTITASGGALTATSVGTAGTGYPASAAFLASPLQAGGLAGQFLLIINSSGVPTTFTFLSGAAGSGYTSATVPYGVIGTQNIPQTSPFVDVFDLANAPNNIYLYAASATTGYTEVKFF